MLVINPRFIATQVLYRVVYQHESLTDVLSDNRVQHSEDKALIQDICLGVCAILNLLVLF